MLSAQTTIADCLHLIRARYLAIPGLCLTKDQVQQLWRLDAVTCDALVDALIDVRFLRRTDQGAYERERAG